MTQSTTHPRRALGTGWSLALAADMTVTVLVAAVLGVIGLLLPGITEDHEMSDAEHFAEAAVFYGSSAFLLVSLGATRLLLHRERRRRLAQWVSAVRLVLLSAAAASVVLYGAATH
ncbi:hypothetical protein [Streptomyces sp. NBC_00690]|uniref:hypothetical protein n=1 Tax=Streptomyces sp. NBC_00690 TaxID=2975808 RepID=UPI002E2E1F35|nr:hypothetical protein [Streptomyces sp. NBC_00690]